MNSIEELIHELSESTCELYHKDRTQKEQVELVEEMLKDIEKLKHKLHEELQVLSEEDLYLEYLHTIASVTADKVLATVRYHKNNEEWQERKIQDLKAKIAYRDSMIINNEIQISRLREKIIELRNKLKEYEENKKELEENYNSYIDNWED